MFKDTALALSLGISVVAALAASSLSVSAADAGASADIPGNGNYSDIAGFWGKEYVQQLGQLGVIAGFPDGTFRPDSNVTRAQFAAMLTQALSLQVPAKRNFFTDVSKKNWASAPIAAVADAGYVGGFPDGTFHPDENISRSQALVILAKTLPDASPERESRTIERYRDARDVPAWANIGVSKAAAERVIVDYPDTTLIRPLDNATRGEIAAMVYQTLRRQGRDLPRITIGLLEEREAPKAEVKLAAKPHLGNINVQPADGLVRAGGQVRVVAHGSPNSQVWFQIKGVVPEVPMQEMQPGKYEGSYAVQPGVAVNNAPVVVRLRNAEGETSEQANAVVNIASSAPKLVPVEPPPGSLIPNRRPAIVVRFESADGINPNSLVLKVNGQNVASFAQIAGNSIRYVPTMPIRANEVRVLVQVADAAGNRQETSWNFAFDSLPPGWRRGQVYAPPAGYRYYPPRPPLTPAQLEEWRLKNDVKRVINDL